jgi:hypothetical protein
MPMHAGSTRADQSGGQSYLKYRAARCLGHICVLLLKTTSKQAHAIHMVSVAGTILLGMCPFNKATTQSEAADVDTASTRHRQ